MGPDPYRDWLAIETDHETPNHYELLGLDLFTGDPAAVRQAYEARYTLVRRYEAGNYSDRALALMAELSDAFKCLTNDSQKSRYDQDLRDTLAVRETSTDVGMLHDTLVERISELEAIVDSDLREDDPLGVATLANGNDLASMPIPATSSYLSPSAAGLPKKEAAKNEFAVPVWLAVLGTCGAGLLVIGAIAFAISLFGSRDDQNSTAQAPAAPNAAGDRAAGKEPVPGSTVSADTGNASEKVEWSGRLARVLVDDGDTLHLLVASSDGVFEARSTDRDLIQQLADYICLAEDADCADDVRVTGTVVDKTASFFDPERRLRDASDGLVVLELQKLVLIKSTRSVENELTSEDKQTLQSLRSVGKYTQFVATVSSAFESESRRFHASFHGRNYLVEIPAAWRAVGVEIELGQHVTVVSRTTGRFESPTGGGGIDDVLLLEVETINQPNFQQVVQSPSQLKGRTLAYRATLRSTVLKDNTATLSLEVQNAGRQFSIKGLARVETGQQAFLETLDGSDPILVEFRVADVESSATYEVVSLTRLNDANNRVVFAAIAASKPEPMPLAGTVAPKPATTVALTGLPDYVDLPPLTSQALVTLVQAVEVTELEIELTNDLIALDAVYRFVAKKADASEALQWGIYLQKTSADITQEAQVAHLAVEDKRLAFRWADNAGKFFAGQLRNCVMQLTSGGQSHQIALRTPLRLGSTPLPTSEDEFQVSFQLTDLPKPETLRRDVELLYDGNKVAPHGGPKTSALVQRLDFKVDQSRDVEIQVSVLRPNNSLVLQAIPRLQLTQNRQIKLSAEDVDVYEQQIGQAIVKAQKDIARAEIELANAQNALSNTSRSATRVRLGGVIQTQSKKIAFNLESIADMKQTLNSVDSLRALASTVQSRTVIRYRVYAEANETSLLLVDGDYREEEALRKQASSGPSDKAMRIDGTWQLIRLEIRGQRIDRADAQQLRLENGQYSSQIGSFDALGTYQIDTSTPPPTITFDGLDSPALRQAGIFFQSGVFKLTSGETELAIAYGANGSRAKDFASTANDGSIVAVYRRVE